MSPASRLVLTTVSAAILSLAPRPAAAEDWLWGTLGGDQMREQSHQVTLTFAPGYASMVVERRVHNGGDRADEAQLDIELPWGGVATGLRLRQAQVGGQPQWFDGQLLDAELAASRYAALTGMAGHEPSLDPYVPRDPALLSWMALGAVSLQIYPVAPHAERTVEYRVELPARWVGGRWVIELGELGLDDRGAQLRVDVADARDQLFVDGAPLAAGRQLQSRDIEELALVPHDVARVGLELASTSVGARTVVNWRVTLGPRLSELPRRARIVVALDLSRSLDPIDVEAERVAALAYLKHFLDPTLEAEVAVLGFDRRSHDLSGGLIPVAEAIELLRTVTFERDNGSDIAGALAHASDLLASAPEDSARRVVLMTDFHTASRLDPATVEAAARDTGAIVHLAELGAADLAALSRADDHLFAAAAATTGGVLWSARAQGEAGVDEATLAVFEEWARPLRIDDLSVSLGAGVELDGSETTLAEGEGLSEFDVVDARVDTLTLTGLTWNLPIRRAQRRSRAASERWAALTFGTDLVYSLDEAEMRALARRGGAVSPVTSYLAVEPGARPSAAGVQHTGLIGKGGGGGQGRGHGAARGAAFGGRLDRQAWLEGQLGARWRRCGGAGLPLTLTLETTYEELVDVELGPIAEPTLAACMDDASWALLLPAGEFVDERRSWTVTLTAARP